MASKPKITTKLTKQQYTISDGKYEVTLNLGEYAEIFNEEGGEEFTFRSEHKEKTKEKWARIVRLLTKAVELIE